jgi:hypothetical protein
MLLHWRTSLLLNFKITGFNSRQMHKLSLRHRIQIVPGAHPVVYIMRTESSFHEKQSNLKMQLNIRLHLVQRRGIDIDPLVRKLETCKLSFLFSPAYIMSCKTRNLNCFCSKSVMSWHVVIGRIIKFRLIPTKMHVSYRGLSVLLVQTPYYKHALHNAHVLVFLSRVVAFCVLSQEYCNVINNINLDNNPFNTFYTMSN